ncbi:hypothetical protein OSB04_001368, partial [Centaurea solstitialis]
MNEGKHKLNKPPRTLKQKADSDVCGPLDVMSKPDYDKLKQTTLNIYNPIKEKLKMVAWKESAVRCMNGDMAWEWGYGKIQLKNVGYGVHCAAASDVRGPLHVMSKPDYDKLKQTTLNILNPIKEKLKMAAWKESAMFDLRGERGTRQGSATMMGKGEQMNDDGAVANDWRRGRRQESAERQIFGSCSLV